MGKAARRTALTAAAATAARSQGGVSLADRVKVMPAMLASSALGRWPGLGRGKVAMMALAALYLLSPIDLVPEAFLTIPGLLDDAVVAAWLMGSLLTASEDYAIDSKFAEAPAPAAWATAERLDVTVPAGSGR